MSERIPHPRTEIAKRLLESPPIVVGEHPVTMMSLDDWRNALATIEADASPLGAAWAEADTAAREKGWKLTGVKWVDEVTDYVGEQRSDVGHWRASADGYDLPEDEEGAFDVAFGRGPTPVAALHALAVKLREPTA